MITAKIHNAHFKEKLSMADLTPGIKPEQRKPDVEELIKQQLGIVG